LQYGQKIRGKLVEKHLPSERTLIATADDLTVAGGVYQIDLETNGVPNPQAAIDQLLLLEDQEPDLKILHINADPKSTVITIQFMDKGPGQFSFTGLLASMPILLGLVFIVVIAYVLWTVYSSNPLILLFLGAIGAGVAFFYFTSGKISSSSAPIYKPRKDDELTTGKVATQERALNKLITQQEDRIAVSRNRITHCEADVDKAETALNSLPKKATQAQRAAAEDRVTGARANCDQMTSDAERIIQKAEEERDRLNAKLARAVGV